MTLDSITPILAITGNVVAVGAAVVATWASIRTIRVERDRDRLAATLSRREQASLVSAWMSRSPDDMATTALRPGQPSIEGRNASDLPIYKVKVYLWIATPSTLDVYLWIDVALLAPTDATRILSDSEIGTAEQQRLMAKGSGVSMEFTDSAGSHWYRARDGVLHELNSSATWQDIEGLPSDFVPPLAPDWIRAKSQSPLLG
jgi:hypothetical protein